MRSKLIRGTVLVLLAAAAFGAGYTVGHRGAFQWMIESLSSETRGNLSQRVETLARLRTGDQDGAIALLELAVDRAAETLPQGQPYSKLPPATQAALRDAKLYREAYPAQDPSPDLAAVLAMVPLPDVEYCSPALRRLVEDAKARREALP